MCLYLHYLLLISLITVVPISIALKGIPKDEFERTTEPNIGPKGMPYNKTTSCKEFGKYARFNPHSIVGTTWFVFYYWSTPKETMVYDFWIPSKKDMKYLHHALDGHLPASFNWSAQLVIMRNSINKRVKLLEEKGDRGQYLAFSIYRDIPNGTMTDYMDIRLKQTGDNKYVGMMECKTHTAYIMSRVQEVPRQKHLQEEAAKLGYRGRKGKSYLYQGHEWMPIPEVDERTFWSSGNKSISAILEGKKKV